MSVTTYCDICGREAAPDYNLAAVVTYNSVRDGASTVMHICGPRDGGDVGCVGFYNAGIQEARDLARAWLREHRPHSLKD